MSRGLRIRFATLGASLGLAAACARSLGVGTGWSGEGDRMESGDQDAAGSGASGGSEGGQTLVVGDGSLVVGSGQQTAPSGPVTDFPDPVLDGTAPSNSPMLFGPATQGATSGGPCLVEPEGDALYPQNWLRPRFRWVAAGGANLFELRIHAANQTSDLVVYTTNTSWTMPSATWDSLRYHSYGQGMTVGVRSGTWSGNALQGEAMGTQTPIGVAPVQATGTIVYWTTNDAITGGSVLKGFSPGDESVETVLTPMQFSQEQGANSQCIGCHTSTPDGEFAAFTTTTVPNDLTHWEGAIARVDPDAGVVGGQASFVTDAGSEALARWNVGGMTFSPAHWQTGDRHAIVSFDNGNSTSDIELSVIDFEALDPTTAAGTIARTGDSQLAGAPNWSHDGNTIAYVSTNRVCTGRLGNCDPGVYDAPADDGSRAAIYTVAYDGGAGGMASPLPGASDPSMQTYYPAFSPDDQWIAFNGIANDLNLYDQPAAELFVIPAAGGTAQRLTANDPPACSGLRSPGLDNVWPKWGPTALQANGNTYYWLIFGSKRMDMTTQQLYMTSIVRASDGSIETHGAVYLWNQPATEHNHTPAWDTFKVPPTPPPR